jgi:CheY-like chemotaxis protein
LLKRLRAEPKTGTIPIILLSVRAGEESRVEAMRLGADDYLIKPFRAREIVGVGRSSPQNVPVSLLGDGELHERGAFSRLCQGELFRASDVFCSPAWRYPNVDFILRHRDEEHSGRLSGITSDSNDSLSPRTGINKD